MPWNCGGYVHVFLLGMLLAQFRVLMAELLSDVEDRTSIHYMFGFWVIQKGNIWIYVGFHRVFGWEWDLIGIYPLVNVYITMENQNSYWDKSLYNLYMAIFNSFLYVYQRVEFGTGETPRVP